MSEKPKKRVDAAADNFYETEKDKEYTFVYKVHENNDYHAHFHSAMEVYYILDGEIEAVVNDVTYRVKKGEILAINPFEVHQYKMIGYALCAVLIFSTNFMTDFYKLYKNQKIKTLLTDKEKNILIFDVIKGIKPSFNNNDYISTLGKKGYINLLLDKIVTSYGTVPKIEASLDITKILEFLYDNYNKTITLDTLAKKFNFSKTSISRMLSKYLHTDLRLFINNLRAEQADILLKNQQYDDKTVIQIAFDCGFDSAATFYRAYKRRFGTLPRRENSKP